MRVPISWLREFVELPQDVTPEHVHAALVKVGLEEEDLHGFEMHGPIVVGEVLEFVDEPQTNGKTIRWCQVRVADDDVRGIVCGAHNFVVGDKVVVSLPGAELPGPFPISARKTYGHISDGMIASARELGLGDEHDGILRLIELDLDPAVGTDAITMLGLDDWAVEVNVTPDRGYALSIRGIAREYSHATGAAFGDPAKIAWLSTAETGAQAAESPVPVTLDDRAPIRGNAGCSLFVTRIVRGVDPSRHSPAWLIARLKLAGIRSISLVVDITNYVMLELGQPIHGYDLDKVSGGITVRRAVAGEKLTTLDDQVRALSDEDLLITDSSGPIGLAGVMGGASTEIGEQTTNVLIEAANFDPVSIARTARRHKLPSEASKRFERGVDPAVAQAAATRVAQLLVELAGGVADAAISQVGQVPAVPPIALPDGYIASLIGVDYTTEEVEGSLRDIGCSVEETAGALSVTPPTWRSDLLTQADLAEEVARIIGYDRIPAILPTAPPGRGLSRAQRLRRSAAQMLAANGMTEVLAYPFVSAQDLTMLGDSPHALSLSNPLDAAAGFLRTTLLPGLIGIARRNLSRGLVDLSLFEFGSVFLPTATVREGADLSSELPRGAQRPSDATLAALTASIPRQPLHAAGLFVGRMLRKQPGRAAVTAELGDALSAVCQLATAVGAEVDVRAGTRAGFHPGRTAELSVGGVVIGHAGELLPALCAELDLPRRVAAFELDLDGLVELAPREVSTHPISSYPAATQDLSLVLVDSVPAWGVRAAILRGAGPLLEQVELVDDYRGDGVEAGMKSLTFALRFRSEDRTLTAAEASEAKLAGVAVAEELFGATLRD